MSFLNNVWDQVQTIWTWNTPESKVQGGGVGSTVSVAGGTVLGVLTGGASEVAGVGSVSAPQAESLNNLPVGTGRPGAPVDTTVAETPAPENKTTALTLAPSGSNAAGSSGSSVATIGSPFKDFASWLPYFLALGGALLLVSETKYEKLGATLAAAIIGTYGLTHYNGIVTGFNSTFGTALPAAATS